MVRYDESSCRCLAIEQSVEEKCEPDDDTISDVTNEHNRVSPAISITSSPDFRKTDHLDRDHEIAIERMTNIFSWTIRKLELAACLPLLLEQEDVPKILKPAHLLLLHQACSPYLYTAEKETVSMDAEFIGNHEEVEELSVDPKLTHIIEVLNGYPEIRALVKIMEKSVSQQSTNFLLYMKYLSEYNEWCVRMSPEEHHEREMKLRKAIRDLDRTRIEMKGLRELLEAERAQHTAAIRKIDEEMAKNQNISDKVKRKIRHDIAVKINSSEWQMVKAYTESKSTQQMLSSQVQKAKENLQEMQKTHLKLEEDLRSKRLKVESQLLAVLGKYDTEIGERQKIMEDLTVESNELKKEHENLEKEMTTQGVLFNELKHERDTALLKASAERVENFKRNRAAKVIQRAWRSYYFRSYAKRKKKSKKTKQTS